MGPRRDRRSSANGRTAAVRPMGLGRRSEDDSGRVALGDFARRIAPPEGWGGFRSAKKGTDPTAISA